MWLSPGQTAVGQATRFCLDHKMPGNPCEATVTNGLRAESMSACANFTDLPPVIEFPVSVTTPGSATKVEHPLRICKGQAVIDAIKAFCTVYFNVEQQPSCGVQLERLVVGEFTARLPSASCCFPLLLVSPACL